MKAKNAGISFPVRFSSGVNMAAKMSKSAFRPCVNGRQEQDEKKAVGKRERVAILDAGAQYGKASERNCRRSLGLWPFKV